MNANIPGNSFAKTLADIGEGGALDELSQTLQEVTAAVVLARRGGEVCLKLKLKPAAGGTIGVTAEISRKLPKPEALESLFYPTAAGLSRNNPNQRELELKTVAPDRAPGEEPKRVAAQ